LKKWGFLVLVICIFLAFFEDIQARTLSDIPAFYQRQLESKNINEELKEITYLNLTVNGTDDLSWLSETNVEILELNLSNNSINLQDLRELKTVKVLKILGVKRLYFRNKEELEEYKSKNSANVKSYSTTDLYIDIISDLVINRDLLSNFSHMNIVTLELDAFRLDNDVNFEELNNYSSLENLIIRPYILKYEGLDKIFLGVNDLELLELNIEVNKTNLTDKDIIFLNKIASLENVKNFTYERLDKIGFKYFKNKDIAMLKIGNNEKFSITDYQNIEYLSNIDFGDMEVYDVAIYFTLNDIFCYEDRGIKIVSDYPNFLEEIKSINEVLNTIIEEINISNNLSKQEIINKVLLYVINNYDYDFMSYFKEIGTTYYNNGYLYGTFNDKKVVCGNYAAMFSALLKRVGIDVYFVMDDNHAWNLIGLDGKYYAMDITALYSSLFSLEYDDSIDSFDAKKKYYGYMDDTFRYFSRNKITNYPEWLNIKVSNKYFRLEAVVWVVMVILGLGVIVLGFLVYVKYKRKTSLFGYNEVIWDNLNTIYRY